MTSGGVPPDPTVPQMRAQRVYVLCDDCGARFWTSVSSARLDAAEARAVAAETQLRAVVESAERYRDDNGCMYGNECFEECQRFAAEDLQESLVAARALLASVPSQTPQESA